MTENYPDYLFEEAAKREAIVAKVSEEDYQKVMEAIEEKKPFYRFFVVDYYATGEGMSFWLKICRNYEPYDDVDREMEEFKEFIGCSHYYPGIEEPTEEEFRTKYAKLIPEYVSKMLDKRDQPGFIWETHYHFNYS
jgi:hypothetical protein